MISEKKVLKKIPKEHKLRIPLLENIGKKILKEYKQKIPF